MTWLAALPNPAYVFSLEDRRFLQVNQLFADLMGYTAEELSQLTLTEIRPEEDKPLLTRALGMDPPEGSAEWRYLTKSGSLLYVRLRYRNMLHTTDPGETIKARFVVVVSSEALPTQSAASLYGGIATER